VEGYTALGTAVSVQPMPNTAAIFVKNTCL